MHIFMFELSLDNFLEKLLYFLSWEKLKKKRIFWTWQTIEYLYGC